MNDLLFQPPEELPNVENNIRLEQSSYQAQWRTKIHRIITKGQDLNRSLLAMQQQHKNQPDALYTTVLRVDTDLLYEAISSLEKELQTRFDRIHASMIKGHKWLRLAGLLPVLNPLTLLEALHNNPRTRSRATIQADILSYAASIHLLRIRDAHRQAEKIQLANEIHNIAHTSWKVEEHIDWLLLEIDFNLIIREDQQQVAQAMIASPSTVSNFVLQMNMGRGKSSVIIPMVASALAGDENLVRVVVPRSLLLQTAQLMSSRLGGLINRRIKHIPFSRKSPTDLDSIKAYHKLHSDVRKDRAVKTQLIYPSGAQATVDGHPTRWKLVQTLLKLAKTHLKQLRSEFQKRMEVINRIPNAFPTVYFLDQGVRDIFLERLTDSVLRGDGGLLPISECSGEELAFAANFLRQAQFGRSTALKVAQVFKKRKDIRVKLLLLRGLLIHKILLMGLSKRWNVQYGIHPFRDPIAVPFRSKGIPSDQAEFGHPDVSILLTCLSFYYSGLTFAQFQQSLGLLLKSDEPVQEFQLWISEAEGFSKSLTSWNSINIDDKIQCTTLWNYLRFQMAVVGFFLNHFVFPRHAKTFDQKLVSSGWDIATPLRASKITVDNNTKANQQPPTAAGRGPRTGSVPTALTVGFSGTNDNKTLLPLNVLQNDLPGLSHTNAEVLTYPLQTRNRRYVPVQDSNGRRLTEEAFLHLLRKQGIRMLLDAGAQILELDNIALAKTWLTVDLEAEAAVFFGEDERARVIYRDGKVVPLAASPYLDNLGACVVYLDEAHTRGVDLKMPSHAVAALTLGVMQTKDHTVQAAMRLRQLAISQSVIFFAPPEVHQSILNTRRGDRTGHLDSHDVINWLLEQTCSNIKQLQPLEISLEELYAPDRKIKVSTIDSSGNAEIAEYVKRLNMIKKEIVDTGGTVQALAHQEVEQEREVAIEVETSPRDEYSRPVHWILWSTITSTALIISDHEANALIPLLRHTSPAAAATHLLTYAAPITKPMVQTFDTLTIFSIPPLPRNWRAPAWLIRDLGIFAGRTYFDPDTQSSAVHEALGLSPLAGPSSSSRTADLDRGMPFSTNEDGAEDKAFSPSPLRFLQEWLGVRRKGRDFEQSLMGEVLFGV
ncbi:MAG: hypothetical protein Q9223_001174 [Gallowayella weberi]